MEKAGEDSKMTHEDNPPSSPPGAIQPLAKPKQPLAKPKQPLAKRKIDTNGGVYGENFGGSIFSADNMTIIQQGSQLNIASGVPKPKPNNSDRKLVFVIEGSLSNDPVSQAKLQAIVRQLQRLTGDTSIEIVDVQEGSIKLTLRGTPRGLERLKQLFDSGQLNEVLGNTVESVEFFEADKSSSNERRPEFVKADKSSSNERRPPKILISEPQPIRQIRPQAAVWAFLIRVFLGGANFIRVNLIRANLSGADLSGADLSRVKLSGADLSRTNLNGADLRWANFSRANLSGADLSGANLKWANLSEANLSGTNLKWAKLNEANLIRANLNEANLIGADVTEASFIDVVGISPHDRTDLERRGAIFDDSPRD